MKSFKGLARENNDRLMLAVGATLLGLLALLVLGGPASASTVTCSGSMKVDRKHPSDNALAYKFRCDEEIQAFSLISNRELNYFTPDVPVLLGNSVAQEETFECEGTVPGQGFGCHGRMSSRGTASGHVGTTSSLCDASVQPRFWIVVQTTEIGTKERPYPITSEPYGLRIRCKVLNAGKKARLRAKKICARVGKADGPKAKSAARKRCRAATQAARRA